MKIKHYIVVDHPGDPNNAADMEKVAQVQSRLMSDAGLHGWHFTIIEAESGWTRIDDGDDEDHKERN